MINNVETLDRQTHELVRPLIACANLKSIRFIRFNVSVELPHGIAEEIELSTSGRSAGQKEENKMSLTFDLKVEGSKGETKIITISGRIAAEYDLPEDANPTPAQIKAFAKTNGMLNVWPYWREFVQTATLRAGLPPLTMPLFRVIHQQSSKP